jgi:hypothetical protein
MREILVLIVTIFTFTSIGFAQTKKPTPKPVAKPTPPTPTAKPSVQPTPKPNKYPDYKITQKRTMDGMSFESTTYSKGVRERAEQKITLDPNDKDSAMIAQMMPNIAKVSQCDLKQDLQISDKKKAYFVDYYDWDSLSPEQKTRRPNRKTVIKGTSTVSASIEDSGKRQEMFGLQAKWLKFTMSVVNSADSCEGKMNMRIEQEGWFVKLSLKSDSCPVFIPESKGGCRPKIIITSNADPGFFLTGTTKMYQDNKLTGTDNVETIALSQATLDQGLFEIPTDYKELDSESELMPGVNEMVDNSATTVIENWVNEDDKTQTKAKGKTIAIDFFSGNASKVNQEELRGYISSKVSAAGMNGFPINSQADLQTGNFVNVIGVELKKIKESGGAKIGGLFGKVTGNSDAAKLGESEAEIAITIYGKDGKTVVATNTASVKLKGSPNDAVKGAIDKIISDLLAKIK